MDTPGRRDAGTPGRRDAGTPGRRDAGTAAVTPARVLGVARTATSAIRLLDALEIFRSDFRVQVMFAVDDGTQFGEGVRELLRQAGARVLSADQVEQTTFDLVLTASENLDLPGIDAPVLVLPHGVGFHKHLPDHSGSAVRLSGVATGYLARDERMLMVLSHEHQRAQLESYAPELVARTVLVQDMFRQRLAASTRWRHRYRRALGVGDRKLIVVTSTWGDESLLGRWQHLPARLLRELPADEYAVAAILHPNVWAGNGPWQVRTWLADAQDAGLILIPPARGWQATVISADVVIGDHGSVTFYAASLDKPLLLASFGAREVVPGTPLAELGQTATHLNWAQGLRTQIDDVITTHRSGCFAAATDRAFTTEPADSLRTTAYGLLGLPEPAGSQPLRMWEVPDVDLTPVAAFRVYTQNIENTISVRRYPAAVGALDDAQDQHNDVVMQHLAVYDDEKDAGRWQSASVVISRDRLDQDDAQAWVSRHGTEHLLAGAVTPSGSVLVARRDGGTLETSSAGEPVEPMLLMAGVYHLLRQGNSLPWSSGTQHPRANDVVNLHIAFADQREATATIRAGPPLSTT